KNSQRLFEANPAVQRRPRRRSEACLAEIVHRFLPQFALDGMMGKPLNMLAEAIPVEYLNRLDDPRVKLAAALQEQTAVRHLVRERVLEGVFEIRRQPDFVDELGGLQPVKCIA